MTATPVRTCRPCGRTSAEVRFRRKHCCVGCDAAEKRERAERVAARGPRLVAVRIADPGACPAHLAWIRALPCGVNSCRSREARQAHHVRVGTGGGTGMKPADRWAVPLCPGHHAEGHRSGWVTFEARYGVDLRWLAQELAVVSPYLTAGSGIQSDE